jgi:hypothetical protein
MLATLGLLLAVMAAITLARPLAEPRRLPVREGFDMRSSPRALAAGLAVIAAVGVFFWVFR